MTASTRVAHDQFENLRTEPLSDTVPWLGADTFAEVASWAVWADETSTDTSWSRDRSVLTWELLGGRLHNRAVFVALNKGTNPVGHASENWSNFHSGRSDYKLARAISQPGVRDVLEGAYLTDFFKGLPTPTAAALDTHLDGLAEHDRRRTLAAMVSLLERELTILRCEDPLLIGLGRAATRWLEEYMDGHRVVGISHYANAMTRAAYAAELSVVAAQVSG